MTRIESAFHHLQASGQKSIQAENIREGFKLNYAPFIDKISNRPGDSFPVYVVPPDADGVIRNRVSQIVAVKEAEAFAQLPDAEQRAMSAFAFREIFKADLPARRFGFETVSDDDKHLCLVIEGMKSLTAPYSPQECRGMTLANCNRIRVHFFQPIDQTPVSSASQAVKFVLLNMSFHYLVPQSLDRTLGANFSPVILSTDAFGLKEAPGNDTQISNVRIFKTPSGKAADDLRDRLTRELDKAMRLLWVLSREPKLFSVSEKDFAHENKSRRIRRLPSFSSIRTMLIDQHELRRLESTRGREIADSLASQGSYSIPGLVLVDEYKKESTGMLVGGHARCADVAVRLAATELLRRKDFDGVAELVREFGNPTTKTRYARSPVIVPHFV